MDQQQEPQESEAKQVTERVVKLRFVTNRHCVSRTPAKIAVLAALSVLVAPVVVTLPAHAQLTRSVKPKAAAAKSSAVVRVAAKRAASADPEEEARLSLVGTYKYSGPFGGQEVRLLRDGTYSLSSYTDVGPQEGEKFGIWSVRQDGAVVLRPTADTPSDTRQKQSLNKPLTPLTLLTLYPIRWEPRLYLIYEHEFVPFRDAVAAVYARRNDRSERNERNERSASVVPFMVREGDRSKPVWGFPEFPARWRSFLPDWNPPPVKPISEPPPPH